MKKMSLLLALGCALTLAGCGDNGGKSGESLRIGFVKMGYGDEFIKNIAKEFSKKYNIDVKFDIRVGQDGIAALNTDLESHSSKNDLFFNKRYDFDKNIWKQESFTVKGERYNCLLEDISDIWNSPVEGESVTLKNKMFDYIEEYYNFDDKYYGVPWASGFMGIVRNLGVWERLGYSESDLPLTTDQMFALCDDVISKQYKTDFGTVSPFIYCFNDEYYTPFINNWVAQYEGKNVAENYFLQGRDPEGEISEYFFTYDGQKYALEVLERLLNPNNHYQNQSDSLAFTATQKWFLTGEALFMVNGSWLESESGNSSAYDDTDFIMTPVVSALSRKLSYFSNNASEDDAKLAQLVKYVDDVDAGKNPTKPEFASDSDIQKVTEARHYSYAAGGVDHQAYIASYAKNKDNAKKFLQFMYSDEGLNIYRDTMTGCVLPATPTQEYKDLEYEISTFKASLIKEMDNRFFFNLNDKAKFFSVGDVSIYYTNGSPALPAAIKTNGYSASKILSLNSEYLRQNIANIKDKLI